LGLTTSRGSLEQRRGRGAEDLAPVRRVEVDRTVDLEDVATAVLVGRDVDAGEVERERGDRADGECTRRWRRTHTPADGAESDVRPPFAGQGTALDRADDAPAGDNDAEVAARRFDQ
jgi:hypothetical protein